jgi:hypothetical protein
MNRRLPEWDVSRLRNSRVASAVRSPPVDARGSLDLATLVRVWRRRLPLIALLGLLCGLGALLVGCGQQSVYEQKLSFVLRPADRLPVEEADRVAGTLADRDSAITQTILGLVQSVPAGSDSGDVDRTVTLRPGSNIIDVVLEGDGPAVAASGRAFLLTAPELVRRSYSIYALEPLGAAGPLTEKASSLGRTVALAVLLGCALGMGVAVLESLARGGRSPEATGTEAEPDLRPVSDEDEKEAPKPARTRGAKR